VTPRPDPASVAPQAGASAFAAVLAGNPAASHAAATAGIAAAAAASALSTVTADTAGTAAVPIDGIAIEIATRALEGKRRFEIRLDPPELGRIDVRLDVARDGQVMSRLVVERADTLDLLRRDAISLERALQSAGLQTGDSGLQFSLRDQSGQQAGGQSDGPRPNLLIVPDEDVVVREAVQRGYNALRGFGRGIDIRV
jgi:chemotaxis protein MotD